MVVRRREVTAAVSSSLGIDVVFSATLAFPATKATFGCRVKKCVRKYATEAYPAELASEKTCNAAGL